MFGSEGTLLIGWKGASYKQDGNSRWVQFGAGYDKIGALKNQLENFVGVVKGEQRPLITPDDALASVKVDRDRVRFDAPEQLAAGGDRRRQWARSSVLDSSDGARRRRRQARRGDARLGQRTHPSRRPGGALVHRRREDLRRVRRR